MSQAPPRWFAGMSSWVLAPLFFVGRWVDVGAAELDVPEREPEGLALILTGIQGGSFLEQQMALGLADAGFAGRVTVIDWTTGWLHRMANHMRNEERHEQAAKDCAARIQAFHENHPAAPIYLLGYSGGGAVALHVLELLPAREQAIVDSVALLAPACSPNFPAAPLADRTRHGLWNYYSPWDRVILGLVTRVIGTTDGVHGRAAGCEGFPEETALAAGNGASRAGGRVWGNFQQRSELGRWFWQYHYSGHFGYANRVWVRETLAPDLGIVAQRA